MVGGAAYEDARRLLGPEKVIGISVSDRAQAEAAAETGCDYIGIGPIYATKTKPDHNPPLGAEGLGDLLEHLNTLPGPTGSWGRDVKKVVIGGVNQDNLSEVCVFSDPSLSIHGIAVVSAIMAAPDAASVCRDFTEKLQTLVPSPSQPALTDPSLHQILANVVAKHPIVHHITNNVVKNFSANVTLAIGASPIMSEDLGEVDDLTKLNGGLVINMGTAGQDAWPLMLGAMQAANDHKNPVVLDPVGAGASSLRRGTAKMLSSDRFCDVIKGNESEIRTLFSDAPVAQRGVDSVSTGTQEEKARITRELAKVRGNVVVMTGVVDYISDGEVVYGVHDGHPYQGIVTGTGCSLGSVIAACLAANRGEPLLAALAAVSYYNAAARIAAGTEGVKGPGSWTPVFLDTLYQLRGRIVAGDLRLAERVKLVQLE